MPDYSTHDPKEEWLSVPEAPDYEVSSLGRVRSFKKGRTLVMRPHLLNGEYLRITLRVSNKPKNFLVHCLVLGAFVGKCSPGLEGSHRNGQSTDNRLSNLLWETSKENQARKQEHGTVPDRRGELNHQAVLTWEKVSDIRSRFTAGGVTQSDLGREFGITQSMVSLIVHNKKWRVDA